MTPNPAEAPLIIFGKMRECEKGNSKKVTTAKNRRPWKIRPKEESMPPHL